MKTATGLTVIAIGAILAFAFTTSPGFLNLHVVGWILMATGGVGLMFTPRSQDWIRRRIVVRRTPPPSARPRNARRLAPAAPAAPAAPPAPAGDQDLTRPMVPGTPVAPRGTGGVVDETIEEYVER